MDLIVDKRIADLLPAHYREFAPRFILFLEKYYDWMYRSSGLSEAEIDDLRNDTSWMEKDINKFISTGQVQYIKSNESLEDTIVELNNIANAGMQSRNLLDTFMLDGDYRSYLSPNPNNTPIAELPTVENRVLDSWFTSMGMDRIKRYRMNSIDNIDQVLMLSLLKHIYAIKGTRASIELFFTLYFDETVTIYQPKESLAVIDDNWKLDSIQVIRDDELFQEFSYVIIVNQGLERYRDIFQSIYLKTIHPAGFRVAIVSQNNYHANHSDILDLATEGAQSGFLTLSVLGTNVYDSDAPVTVGGTQISSQTEYMVI